MQIVKKNVRPKSRNVGIWYCIFTITCIFTLVIILLSYLLFGFQWWVYLVLVMLLSMLIISIIVIYISRRKPTCPICNMPLKETPETQISISEYEPTQHKTSGKLRYCSNCGEKIDGNEKFCKYCGYKL